MIRMLIPIVVLFLIVLLVRTFMMRGEQPIDVDPVTSSRGDGDDDVIDVDPVEVK